MPPENDAQQPTDEAQQTAGEAPQGEQQAPTDPYAELASVAQELNLTPEQIKGRLEASKVWEHRAKTSDTVSRKAYDQIKAELDSVKNVQGDKQPTPSTNDDALEAAREEGRRAAAEEAFRETSEAMLRVALRSRGLTGEDDLAEVVASTNVAFFRGDDGRIDDEKIARFAERQTATAAHRWPDMGQDKRPAPLRSGLQAGREAWAQERNKK